MRLSIVGCGAIGSELLAFAAKEPEIVSVRLYDAVSGRARSLAKTCKKARAVAKPEDLLRKTDLFVEAASQQAAREWLPRAVDAGVSLLTMSLGALEDDAFREGLVARARSRGVKIYLPSGAVVGVDGLKAGARAGIKSVTLVTTKPPQGLGVKVEKWTLLFDGTAREAVRRFPQNVNVAAVLAIAGVGFDQTRVQVVADPLATRNSHKVIIEGNFGRIRTEVENLPSPTNPKTSWLAGLSAIATLRRLLEPIQLGA